MEHKGLPVEAFASQGEWDRWLAKHGAASSGLWLKFAKKTSGAVTVSKAEAIESALAHGWIDGQLDRFDESYWLVRFTPRGPASKWSKINRDTALRLIADERMKKRGMLEVERAQSDGRWEAAYASQGNSVVPDDLSEALAHEPTARAFFATVDAANRYAILYRLHHAKTPEARAKLITKFVAMLARHETIHAKREKNTS
jgi:uncharacterized protein YdeI (YjbR/CyaY-like superfamily)